MEALVRASLEESARVKQAAAAALAEPIARAGEWIAAAYRAGGKTLLFGNGGSASDAQHIAAEWTGKLGPDRAALPSIALSANTSDLTAIGNDYGFERVFARLVEAHGRAGDVAIAISTSGNSPNVIAAVEEARRRGLRTIGLLGKGGGKLRRPGRARAGRAVLGHAAHPGVPHRDRARDRRAGRSLALPGARSARETPAPAHRPRARADGVGTRTPEQGATRPGGEALPARVARSSAFLAGLPGILAAADLRAVIEASARAPRAATSSCSGASART